jgi:hypothetical protein
MFPIQQECPHCGRWFWPERPEAPYCGCSPPLADEGETSTPWQTRGFLLSLGAVAVFGWLNYG